jgi:hypothetical protein
MFVIFTLMKLFYKNIKKIIDYKLLDISLLKYTIRLTD